MMATNTNPKQRLLDIWRQYVGPWYQRLQSREQRLVLGAVMLLPLLVLVFGIWMPLRDDAAAIRAGLPALQTELAEAQMLAAKVSKGGVATAAHGDLLSMVDGAARGSNIRQFITRIKPQPMGSGQSVLVQLRKAPYADTVRFLAQMAGQGIATERAKMSDVEANGLVDVDITFATR